ncbi:chemotaxis protein CheD [Anaerovorax odorimutans]|uniref:chemotaxis protein CheD n=1 Tax=Anaerovorax odorimutans TaxID=109327 RepID=UPI00041EC241|nr:chemotaxis protein CheD [Anaerovorax odorimutans]
MSNMTSVGISDMKIIKGNGCLITYALGSCVGICIYDSRTKLAGMVHIMLPNAPNGDNANPYKYADVGIKNMISKMISMGAVKSNLFAKIAGGAKMFEIFDDNAFGNIGKRNIITVKDVLQGERIPIKGEQVGANYARTLLFCAENGEAKVRTAGSKETIF